MTSQVTQQASFTQEQLNQLSQLIQTQTQQSVQAALHNDAQTVSNVNNDTSTHGVYVGSARVEFASHVDQLESGNKHKLNKSVWIVDT